MAPSTGFLSEARALLRLGAPIVATQLFVVGMGFLDTAMAGRYSATDLAGVALGGAILWPVFLFMTGLTMALTPMVSQLVGAMRTGDAGDIIRQGLWIAIIASLVTMLIVRNAEPLLSFMEVDAAIAQVAVGYLKAVSWGMPGAMAYIALRLACEGLGRTRPPMVIAGLAFLINAPLNYLLIYGAYGFPELGGVGCGWATAVVMWLELALMFRVIRKPFFRATGFFGDNLAAASTEPSDRPMAGSVSGYDENKARTGPGWSLIEPVADSISGAYEGPPAGPGRSPLSFSWNTALRILRLGLPIGCTIFLEMSVYSCIGFLVAGIGVNPMAGHSIANNLNWLTYVIPMGLGSAAAIRVGVHVGGQNPAGARRVSATAFQVSLVYALIVSVLLIGLRFLLVGIYTSDPEVVRIAASLMIFIAVYQIFDDTNATMAGALRGYKDTRVPMVISLVGYWLIALPLGIALAHGWLGQLAPGVYGYWAGMTIGLFLVAVCTGIRLRRTSRDLARIDRLATG